MVSQVCAHIFVCIFFVICFYVGASCPRQSGGMSLAAVRRLLRLRLALAEFSLAVLEEHCAEERRQALAREKKTSAEIALEEFTRCTPEPNSIQQVTQCTHNLGQMFCITWHSNDVLYLSKRLFQSVFTHAIKLHCCPTTIKRIRLVER